MTVTKLAILMPLLNDWDSFQILVSEIETQIASLPALLVDIHVVDDYSIPVKRIEPELKTLRSIHFHRLCRNLGHQRAICVGLVTIAEQDRYDCVIVMDADGEDCPAYISPMLETFQRTGQIVVARRQRRSESVAFRFFYWIYKQFFRLLTGQNIDFGNFCLIPRGALRSLVYYAGLWNHLAATIVASQMPLTKIDTRRCERFSGKSKMNFTALAIHGLSAISLFIEVVTFRLFLGMLVLGVWAIVGIFIVIMLRFLTDLAIEGWATSAAGILFIVALQGVAIITVVLLFLLQMRSSVTIIPRRDVGLFVDSTFIVTNQSADFLREDGAETSG